MSMKFKRSVREKVLPGDISQNSGGSGGSKKGVDSEGA